MNPVWLVLVSVVFIVGDVIREKIRGDEVRLLVHAVIARNAGEVKTLQADLPRRIDIGGRRLRQPEESEAEFADVPIRAMGL